MEDIPLRNAQHGPSMKSERLLHNSILCITCDSHGINARDKQSVRFMFKIG